METETRKNNIEPTPDFKVLEVQPTQDNPKVINNYPYGYSRTLKRYWVETTNNGQRIVSQTLDPKTQLWNKPKKSTYSQIVLMIEIIENGHISFITLSASYRSLEECQKFGNKYSKYFSDYQQREFKGIIGLQKVYDKVEFTINQQYFKHRETGEIMTQVDIFDLDKVDRCNQNGNLIDEEAQENKQKELNRNINKCAVLSANNEGLTIQESLDAFKRS